MSYHQLSVHIITRRSASQPLPQQQCSLSLPAPCFVPLSQQPQSPQQQCSMSPTAPCFVPLSHKQQQQHFNCRVDPDDLAKLHAVHPWIPGAEHIRPAPQTKFTKLLYMRDVLGTHLSQADHVLEIVLGLSPCISALDGRHFFPRDPATGSLLLPPGAAQAKAFEPNAFPYLLPPGTHHSVMWYARPQHLC
eukprot:TRINITY_DN4629_c0_g1_i1.p1 TRINITY_DN4629_c0_g1~~TRINITY_DN4629_c0_g1_i1.p1  ORF type:complete len:191 (+),score=48.54 TRINITY_DN4629_c0_g1_i1:7-579(+)